ncbi:PCMT domain-containing protein [Rhizoctonia solani AG-1 IA]|uniref:protein-L-isoaspartate(D-aspartate) O-methyltransferase n=1 Tax=Thanatephorus cucumeris (strain AG1-IA) TaxID=983506 RepID=L8WUU7_THACA|nr:PCMT domain-containing protein [Rhizoctonia solani AG-1 IA]
MAWACSGKTNVELVNNMLNAGLFKSELVGEHAHAAEHLLPLLKPGAKVLDVGSGSGYTCAIFHHLVNPTGSEGGKVVGIDHISELVDWSADNLKRDGLGAYISNGAIKMVCGDGRLGYPSAGPYNVIHVGAAAPTMPQQLVEQLARPGRMFVPVGLLVSATNHTDRSAVGPDGGAQYIYQVDKDESGNVKEEKLFGVRRKNRSVRRACIIDPTSRCLSAALLGQSDLDITCRFNAFMYFIQVGAKKTRNHML